MVPNGPKEVHRAAGVSGIWTAANTMVGFFFWVGKEVGKEGGNPGCVHSFLVTLHCLGAIYCF